MSLLPLALFPLLLLPLWHEAHPLLRPSCSSYLLLLPPLPSPLLLLLLALPVSPEASPYRTHLWSLPLVPLSVLFFPLYLPSFPLRSLLWYCPCLSAPSLLFLNPSVSHSQASSLPLLLSLYPL